MIIRRAVLGDIEKIKAVVRSSFHENYAAAGEFYSAQQLADPNYATQTGPYYSREIFISDIINGLPEKLAKPFETFVACDGSKVAGFITIENNNGKRWVNTIFVGKSYQRLGLGKELFEFAAGGKGGLYLWVNSKNPAVGFWKKLGFRPVLQEMLMRKK